MQGMMWIAYFFLLLILLVATRELYKKHMRKGAAAIIVLILVLTGIFFGISGEYRYYEYYYVVEIKPTDLSEYEIYLPLALNSRNLVHPIMEDLDVEGDNVKTEIVSSQHGKVLKITGTGDAEIYAESIGGETTFFGEPLSYQEIFHLNLLEHTERDQDFHWIYMNISWRFSISITLHASIEKGKSSGMIISIPWIKEGERTEFDIETALDTSGWHSVGVREAVVEILE